jgi:hypothetical protein
MTPPVNQQPVETVFESLDSPIFEITAVPSEPEPPSPAMLLHLMRERVKYYGSPIPEGYVPPPGIDLESLLKQVPWPPTA